MKATKKRLINNFSFCNFFRKKLIFGKAGNRIILKKSNAAKIYKLKLWKLE